MNMKDCRGEIQPPIRIMGGIKAQDIADVLKTGCQQKGIPATVVSTTIHSGGFLFGSDYPCVMVSHPKPPQQYFDLLFIVNGDVVTFQYWGNSKANYDRNKKAQLQNEGKFSAIFVKDDPMALQTEGLWQQDVLSVFSEEWHYIDR